jgi:hypothetical protein
VIGLPRSLKLTFEIGSLLLGEGREMALLVPIHCTFADPIRGRNGSERLSSYEPLVDGDKIWMGANGAQARHLCLSMPILINERLNFRMLILPHSCGNRDTPSGTPRHVIMDH